MKLTSLAITVGAVCTAGQAAAGGLFLPGSGAVSTSRAGASVASTDDGEALAINAAGLAKAHSGTEITVSAAIINYAMSFTRTGSYDPITDPNASAEDHAYEGQKYPTVSNAARPPLAIAGYQPVPIITVVSDLGGLVKGLHVAAGLYAPNAYPFRDMTNVNGHPFEFNSNFDQPPPPTRYDILTQEAAFILPSLAAGYRVTPDLDIGGRFSLGFATVKSTVALWGVPANYSEWVKQDGTVKLEATESMIPNYALGATYRPTPAIELAANYNAQISVNTVGTAVAQNGPAVNLAGATVVISPVDDAVARCAKGGTGTALKGCASFDLPMNAQVGGRYKFLDGNGAVRGDVELDLDWENWGNNESDYRVVVDAQVATTNNPDGGIPLKDSIIRHGFRDTYAARVGGSYVIPMDANTLTLRGGLGYDTAAAKTGWERVDLDGAARETITIGAGYKMHRVEINAGLGVILEGTRTNPGTCNPTASMMGCAGNNMDQPQGSRQGPDPTNPILDANVQSENPVNQGTISSHYVMLMLGMSTWF